MHRSLFEKVKILHREISENNIIITDPEMADGFTGMLIDLDPAIEDGKRTGGRQMTGTMEFMATDVLRGVEHTYRHGLYSFVYVLLWMYARCAWERKFQCKHKRPAQEEYFGEVVWEQCCRCRRREAMEYTHWCGLKVFWMSLCRHFLLHQAPV